jgi:hypothetical protein
MDCQLPTTNDMPKRAANMRLKMTAASSAYAFFYHKHNQRQQGKPNEARRLCEFV